MQVYAAIIEKCPDIGYYVGYVPNFPGAQSSLCKEVRGLRSCSSRRDGPC